MSKRLDGIRKHGKDIVKSTVKRIFSIDKETADRRMAICDTCPSKVPDEVFGGTMCKECFCNHKTLIYSTEKGCELDKW